MKVGIDAHIHLEKYEPAEQEQMLRDCSRAGVSGMIAVSMDLASAKRTSALAKQHPTLVFPAYGYHPEQAVPTPHEQEQLVAWIREHAAEMVAVGEVGLPYYLRQEMEEKGKAFVLEPYIELLDTFIRLAKELDKPIVLHAVYDDAAIACDMLEKHRVNRAHFHWYKGPVETTERMIRNGYYISLTPDVLYEPDIQELASLYPLSQLMVETDGPWPFEGPFAGKMTHPAMIADVVAKLAELKGLANEQIAERVYANTCAFYRIKE
ncbi:TatD family deoxyribonuclease [Brevibacillus fluminis]|uniref:TatD family deoxyribonuclease n=1 Tax=Brevibacillus fluminis TaxID=511487 RepID=A0A3M8DK78_9BACL|nr:TatD family hydrolase [Brevibacillus fluminis]RNB87805.1 TatD family deoxyribonuclease [Brevibacillus fluminis]